MDFFEMISAYADMIWSNVSAVPLFNTGITFGQFIIGFIGLSVVGFIFSRFFGFMSGVGSKLTYSRGPRSKNERISSDRRYDER